MTQDDLAAKSSVGVRTIRAIEGGRVVSPRPGTVRMLADALALVGVDRDRFFEAASSGHSAPVDPTAVVPNQLPMDIVGFTGRVAELARLDELLDLHGEQATAVVIGAMSGTAGVGKTALAVHWGHRAARRFRDGQLYVNLRGFDPVGRPVRPAEAMRSVLDALGVPAERIPSDPQARLGLYRSSLAGQRVFLLLDNARDAEQVRPLLPGTATVFTVVTSRERLTSLVALDGAHLLTAELLSTVEAERLLAARLGAGQVAAEPDAVGQIVEACAGLPLALVIAAARAQESGSALASVAADLADAARRLETLDAGDPASQVRTVFSWSYGTLGTPAARLFRLLGLHRGPDISTDAAASLAGEAPAEVRRRLAELVRANLLTESATGRYTMHDLLRAYSFELARSDPPADRRAALTRVFDHYVHAAHTADRLLGPVREPIPLGLSQPAPGTTMAAIVDYEEAMAWLTAERPVLLMAVEQAAGHGFDTHAFQLAWSVDTVLNRRGHWLERVGVWRAVLDSASRLGDPAAECYVHRRLANAGARLGEYDLARLHGERAIELSRRVGDRAAEAHSHIGVAMVLQRLGRPAEALDHAQQALDQFQDTGHGFGTASAHNAVAWCHAELGHGAEAARHGEQAVAAFEELGDRSGQAYALDSLGFGYHRLGRHDLAADSYRHAIELHRVLQDSYQEADTLVHLGDTLHTGGDGDAARAAWREALDILTDLDHPDAEDVQTRLDAPGSGTDAPH
jgi:tetratricopeptide (TPR) repeat protein